VLTGAEIKVFVENLPVHERTLVLLAASTGLRQGELFGLQWRDVDFEHGELNVIRSIVCGDRALQDRIFAETSSDGCSARHSVKDVESTVQVQSRG